MLFKFHIVMMIVCFSAFTSARPSLPQLHHVHSLLQTVIAEKNVQRYNWQKLKHYSYQNHHQFRGAHRNFYHGNGRNYRNNFHNYHGQNRLDNIGTRFRGNIYTNPNQIYRNKYRLNNMLKKHNHRLQNRWKNYDNENGLYY